MALPSSGTITWEMIRAEFGGGYPIYMSQYYRGGGRVPDVSQNSRIPTSGAIGAWHFYGATNSSLVLTPKNVYTERFRAEPAPGSAGLSGSCTASGAGLTSGTWTRLSGSHTVTTYDNGLRASFSGTVQKNTTSGSSWQFNGNNGLSGVVTVDFYYYTDL